MLRKLLTVIALFGITSYSIAQTQSGTLKGTITEDATGESVPMANVVVELNGAIIAGAVADFDGKYTIKPIDPGKYTVKISFIGFESQTVSVANTDNISVQLIAADSSLDEVVVTGYGTQLRRNITGSVATIDSEVIENRALTSAGAALSGTTAGVFVSQNSGEAGQDEISIRVRGQSTLNLSLIHI